MKNPFGFQVGQEGISFHDLLRQQRKALFKRERLRTAFPQHDGRFVGLSDVSLRGYGALGERCHKLCVIHCFVIQPNLGSHLWRCGAMLFCSLVARALACSGGLSRRSGSFSKTAG